MECEVTMVKSEWQAIETAPKDGTTVLVWFVQHGAMSVIWTDREDGPNSPYAHWHIDDHKHGPYPVRGYRIGDDTHWMPLPDAPPAPLTGGRSDAD